MLVPAATPVTTPALVIVATDAVADVQGVVASGLTEPLKVVVEPAQTAKIPVIVGKAFTVTVIEQLDEFPQASITVQVMVDTPELNWPLASFPEPFLMVTPVILNVVVKAP